MNIENFTMTDQMGGATFINKVEEEKPIEKNIGKEQMEFSSPIQDVMSAPIDSPPLMSSGMGGPASDQYAVSSTDRKKSSSYPLGLNKVQFESLLAGVSAAIIASGPVQEKIIDMLPSFINETTGHISATGLAATVVLVAIVFYMIKQFVVKSH
jgi:hypothetical protein